MNLQDQDNSLTGILYQLRSFFTVDNKNKTTQLVDSGEDHLHAVARLVTAASVSEADVLMALWPRLQRLFCGRILTLSLELCTQLPLASHTDRMMGAGKLGTECA